MLSKLGIIVLLFTLPFAAVSEPFSVSTNGMADLSSRLESHLQTNRFPALAAAVIQGTNIAAAGVTGFRKIGEQPVVTLQDKFHIGSCTKSFTALLAVILKSEGIIHLTNRVSDVLPWDIPERTREITLIQLLQNRSGLGNEPAPKLWRKAFEKTGTPQEQRQTILPQFLEAPLKSAPGSEYYYSNFGFALAGAMLETAANRPWEELIRDRIFRPLALKSGGFGPPSEGTSVDQPWGHVWEKDKASPVPPLDNPATIAPGGAIHMTTLDLAKYAAYHLAIARGKVASLRRFHTVLYTPPKDSSYALGWMTGERDWAGGKVITHEGSNTMFFSVIWIAPAKDLAVIVSTNVGDRGRYVAEECDKVVAELIREFMTKS